MSVDRRSDNLGGYRVPYSGTKVGAKSQLSWPPTSLDSFSVIDLEVYFGQGEETFSINGEKRVANAYGLAIIV